MDGGGIFTEEKDIRNNHSMTSALHILKNRNNIKADGGDADKIALLAFLHSKKASAVDALNDSAQIKAAVERLSCMVGEYATSPDHYFTSVNFTLEIIEQVKNNATALRLGDAFGHDSSSDRTQNGGRMKINPYSANLDATKWQDEIEKSDLKYYGNGSNTQINNRNDPHGTTRMYQFGEGNIRVMKSQVAKNGGFEAVIEVNDGSSFPLCTQECIRERIKEMDTATHLKRTMTIIVHEYASKPQNNGLVKSSYNKFIEAVEKDFFPIKFNVSYAGGVTNEINK